MLMLVTPFPCWITIKFAGKEPDINKYVPDFERRITDEHYTLLLVSLKKLSQYNIMGSEKQSCLRNGYVHSARFDQTRASFV